MNLVITGASGKLGSYLLKEAQRSGRRAIAWSGSQTGTRFGFPLRPVALSHSDDIASAFRQAHPHTIIHTAALSQVSECYASPQKAQRINVEATQRLVRLAADAGARFIYTSTDMVFDGDKGDYSESDPPQPLSVYGQSKLSAEKAVLNIPAGVVARISLLFGPSLFASTPSFFDQMLQSLRSGHSLHCFTDEWRTPLSFAVAARALMALADSEFTGLIHLGGPERLSRWDMAQRLAHHLKVNPVQVIAASREQFSASEPRPRDLSLDSSLWRRQFPAETWPQWDEALNEFGLK